jgi:CBS domain-containing protein/anti-sigma regulatory factor (Ser/Thr protein kinase)
MTDQLPLKGRLITDQAAEDITRAEELAYELKVSEVMTTNPLTVTEDLHMDEVLDMFRAQRISGAPVLQNGKLVGVISLEDLINCLRKSDSRSFVAKYMTAKLITIRPTDPVIEALKLFVNASVGRLLVVNEEGQLVGIITKGDITSGLLKALQKDYQVEEIRRYRASHLFEDIESDRTSLILRYRIKPKDFTNGGAASSQIKRALLRLGANPQIARRCGIAVYEAEMNLIIHTNNGGTIRTEIESHQISIEAVDEGPGIANVELAMKPGFSTASQEIRELGFGAGMGLANISRCTDEMRLESELGKGTRLRMKILLPKEDTFGEGYPSAKENEK